MKIPLLKLKDILLASIQEDLTDNDAIVFQRDLIEEVNRTEVKGVVIDITAMDMIDSFLARVINETANMARLQGTEVVVCGMQPCVALTLVEMGRELIGVESALNLEQGMERIEALVAAPSDTGFFAKGGNGRG